VGVMKLQPLLDVIIIIIIILISKVTILLNQQIQTDRTIPSNKPDIVIHNYENRTCMLIVVVIPGDRNVIQKEAEKILKYMVLTIEIQHM
jgi:hypothetical protein